MMKLEVGTSIEPQEEVAVDALVRTARVTHDLGIRTEVSLPRLPGLVDDARALAECLDLDATVEIGVNEVCVRFVPRFGISDM
jgi:hypothetical protein